MMTVKPLDPPAPPAAPPAVDPTTTLDPSERTRCEVWTRCMGYHRPIAYFNPGKLAEHHERRYFLESRA